MEVWITKKELLQQAKTIYPSTIYKIQKVAEKFTENFFHIKILLPVAHHELNPIEMFCFKTKRQIASINLSFSLSTVEKLTRSPVESFLAAEFQIFVEHYKKEEDKFKSLSLCEQTVLELHVPLSLSNCPMGHL